MVTFIFLRRVWLDVVTNIRLSSYNVLVILFRFQWNINFVHSFWKAQYQFLWKSVQWEPSCLVRTDIWTDSHVEPNSHFSEICEVPKTYHIVMNLKHSQDTFLCLFDSKEQRLTKK